jgi:hypothetical protein
MAIKMRISKSKGITCNACGNDEKQSVVMFDMRLAIKGQNGLILCLCDRCISEMMDKTLKARCMVDGMIKSPQQMRVINGRKQAEMKIREKEMEKAKEMYKGDGD